MFGIPNILALAAKRAIAKTTPRSEVAALVIDGAQLKAAVPNITNGNVALYLPALNDTLLKFGIVTPKRIAHFLAQVGHESMDFSVVTENLNYSAKGLRRVFGSKYFKPIVKDGKVIGHEADTYARRPEAIANRVYANRMGNGPESSGDGWRYRGRGLIQLTGKENYARLSKALGYDFVADPDAVAQLPWAVLAAGWYWHGRELNFHADGDNMIDRVVKITQIINGGDNGLQDRIWRFRIAKKVLGVK